MEKLERNFTFNDGEIYEGFKCIKQEEIKDIKSYGYVFEHEKTKARLVYIKNDDNNKVFSIAFRTPPTNNTGIPHIIEHSTLCGSKKYPVKEPFVELLKGSVNTFLNAMTFPDKTLYPIASTNDKDYKNLMNVYLDAVFNPNIYNKKEIFMQEGWHYELLNKKDPLTYKGVVYNEMKGVYSSPDAVLFYESLKSLYPDNIYGKEYGGYPKEIPQLTYEEFLGFHSKYYHPSNSYIYLYGNLDVLDAMKTIDEEYLSNYNYKEIDSAIKKQEPLAERSYVKKPYAVSNDSEDVSMKTIMSMNYSVGMSSDTELAFAMRILESYLVELNASPLKKVIVEEGLCNDLNGMYEEDLMQPVLSFTFTEMKEEDENKIVTNVENELKRIVNEGIDCELMESIINQAEFAYRRLSEGEPMGLGYNYKLFQTWLYDSDPLSSLYFEDNIKNIRDKYKNGYFEELIKKYLLENNHSSIVVLIPDLTLKEKEEKKLQEKLEDIKAKMSDKELNEIIKSTKRLIKMQMKPDRKKDVAKIPMLKIDDIDKKAEELDCKEDNVNGCNVYYNEGMTNKISYFSLTFNSKRVKKEDIPYINLIANLLTEVSTQNMSYDEIAKKVGLCAGDLTFISQAITDRNNTDKYDANICCYFEVLQDKRFELLNIAKEVILNTKFDEDRKIKEVISRLRVVLEEELMAQGHAVALRRIQSYYSKYGKYNDLISGISFYEFICDLDSNFEEKKEEIKKKLYEVSNAIFIKNDLRVVYAGEEGTYEDTKKALEEMINSLKDSEEYELNDYEFEDNILNEAIMTQSDVQYVGMGANFIKLGYKYSGAIQVLQHILEYDYLWNHVRVKGGAYGSKLAVSASGDFIFASYRDPNLEETYNNYKNTYKYLNSFKGEKDFAKYIIGTIGAFDKPHFLYVNTLKAARRKMYNITQDEIQKERDEMLHTTPKDIKNYSKMLKDITDKNIVCTIGNERKLKNSKNIFKTFRTLKEVKSQEE